MMATPLQARYDDVPLQQPAKVSILIVDDLPEKHIVYKTILEELGQNLVFVHSGEEALKQVLQQEFAVILLDVNMPGMNGFETASMIRGRRKSAGTPIIFLTAFTDEMHATQGYASGAVDYLPTPVVPEVLKAKVRVFIELSQMRQLAAFQAEERAKRTAAEEAARRSDFLVRASEVLGHAQKDPREILNALVRVAVPYLADAGIFWRAGGNSDTWRIEWAANDTTEDAQEEKLVSSLSWLQGAVDKAAASRQLQVLEDLPVSPGQSVLPFLRAAIAIPILIQEELHGVFVLARASSYHQSDVFLANDLAARAGVALENAMLIERIQEGDRKKDEFLATLAHELRNPLAPVSNGLQIMNMGGLSKDRMAEVNEMMLRQVHHMNRLIDDLLDVSRITRGRIELKKETVSLANIIQSAVETIRPMIEQAGHVLTLDLPQEPVYLHGDATRLAQVFSNLLNNAAKYTEPGGNILLKVTPEEGHITAIVRDSGIGIPTGMLPKVFDMFTQVDSSIERSRGGLGIGLKLVKELCELHGGSVTAASSGADKGSEFTVRLPTVKPDDAAAAADGKDGSKTVYRILVVDDNEESAKTMMWMMELLGHEVQIAFDGQSAIELAKVFRPQAVLLDIGLPGMNGYEVCKQMRQDPLFRDTVFVAQTGWGQAEHRQRSKEAGFRHHLVKPVNLDTLQSLLQDIGRGS